VGTGRVELLDYLVVEDVGRIVNPLTLHGQAIVLEALDLFGMLRLAPNQHALLHGRSRS
jgi:hypothetical protein